MKYQALYVLKVNEYITELSTCYSCVWHFKGYIGNVVGGNLIFKTGSIVSDQAEETHTSLLILIGRELQGYDQTVQMMSLSAPTLLLYQINRFSSDIIAIMLFGIE